MWPLYKSCSCRLQQCISLQLVSESLNCRVQTDVRPQKRSPLSPLMDVQQSQSKKRKVSQFFKRSSKGTAMDKNIHDSVDDDDDAIAGTRSAL